MTRDGVSPRATESAGSGANPPGGTEFGLTYARVARLPVAIERCELLPLVRDTSSGFTKVSIVARLSGEGHDGEGEDVTWDQIDQIELLRGGDRLTWLRGDRTFDEFSTLLGLADLFPVEPIRDSARFYRRWAFESAALDLALRQNGLALQDAVGRVAKPVTFVASFRIGDPASLAPVRALRRMDPSLHFKLDPTASWDDDLLAELASLACVDVVDMKALPWPPRVLNLKPARFGSVRRLFETYDYCRAHGIGSYGGGMFEQR